MSERRCPVPSFEEISALVEEVRQRAQVSADAKAQSVLDAEASKTAMETAQSSHTEWSAAHDSLADAVTAVNAALAELVEQDKAGTNVPSSRGRATPQSPAKTVPLKR
jgi:hypothetical protein